MKTPTDARSRAEAVANKWYAQQRTNAGQPLADFLAQALAEARAEAIKDLRDVPNRFSDAAEIIDECLANKKPITVQDFLRASAERYRKVLGEAQAARESGH